MSCPYRHCGSVALEAKHEFGIRENPAQRHFDALFEVAVLAAGPIEIHQRFDIRIRYRTAVGASRQVRNNFSCADRLICNGNWMANENPRSAWCIPGPSDAVWADDLDTGQVRN